MKFLKDVLKLEADSTRIADFLKADHTRIFYDMDPCKISVQRPLGRKDQREISFYTHDKIIL